MSFGAFRLSERQIGRVVSVVLTLVVVAVAWIFYRPVLAVVLLVLAGAGVFLLLKKRGSAVK